MSSKLFEDIPELKPAARVKHPPLWIQRLLILREFDPSVEPEREIEFRTGLNIIATKKAQKNQHGSRGHNVGKTLLTRLIRYCLSESKFARDNDRAAIGRLLPDGYVIAEFFVEGKLWTVARSIGQNHRAPSYAWSGTPWQEATLEAAQSYSEFRAVLDSSLLSKLPSVKLPNSNREILWSDLLAWCSRDQRCAYQHPLEWRSKWSESGKADLSRQDASLIVRACMNLFDPDEAKVLSDREEAKQQWDDAEKQVNSLETERQEIEEALVSDFGFTEQTLVDASLRKSLKSADNEVNDLMAEVKAVRKEYGLDELEQAVKDAADDLHEATTSLNALKKTIEGSSLEDLSDPEPPDEDDLLQDIVEGCPLTRDDCPVHDEQQKQQRRDSLKTSQRDRKIVNRVAQQIGEYRVAVTQKKATLKIAKQRLKDRSDAAEGDLRPHETNLEQWQELRKLLRRWYELQDALEEANKAAKRHEKRHGRLTKKLKDFAQSSTTRLRKLNRSFQIIQQELFGKDGLDRIRIDINKLSFPTDDDASSPGDGMSASTTLSLDVACLRASLEGLGHFPRFIIHDSPRAGDLEDNCYAALFRLVQSFEVPFDEPPFQYIVTTTTQPPPELRKTKYVRGVLASDDPDSRLLRREF